MSSSSCTLAKPLVCAVTAPVYVLGHGGANVGGGGGGQPLLYGLVAVSAVGAAGGLVTGVISDIHYLCGHTDDPTRNLWHPFATNVR